MQKIYQAKSKDDTVWDEIEQNAAVPNGWYLDKDEALASFGDEAPEPDAPKKRGPKPKVKGDEAPE